MNESYLGDDEIAKLGALVSVLSTLKAMFCSYSKEDFDRLHRSLDRLRNAEMISDDGYDRMTRFIELLRNMILV